MTYPGELNSHSLSNVFLGIWPLWDPLRTRAIPERFRSMFTTRRHTYPRLPYLTFIEIKQLKFLHRYICNDKLRHWSLICPLVIESQREQYGIINNRLVS